MNFQRPLLLCCTWPLLCGLHFPAWDSMSPLVSSWDSCGTSEAEHVESEGRHLLNQLEAARQRARPEVNNGLMVSNFQVGAAARGESGNVYLGMNLEFRGVGLESTVHAEEFAIVAALGHRETRIRALAVSSPPCGYCRQLLCELGAPSDLRIYIAPNTTPVTLDKLLPSSFGPADMGTDQHLLSIQNHGLAMEESQADPLSLLALEFANHSYSPYTTCPSGVAFRLKSGQDVGGAYTENAAFNPSISPLKAALVAVALAGGELEDVAEVVLVELPGRAVSHAPSVRAFCAAVLTSCTVRVCHAVKAAR